MSTTTIPTDVSPLGAAALLYAALNWPVVPLHSPGADGVCDCHQPDAGDPVKHAIGKHPRTEHGLKDATCDTDVILRWWRMWPHANIGVDLARAGLVDVAPDSLEWFAEFTARGGLPSPLRFASGGGPGHVHHLYARPEGCALYRDCHTGEYDVMSAGYAVMPPSLHYTQRSYTWEAPANGAIVTNGVAIPAPTWVVKQLNARSQRVVAPIRDDDPDGPPVDLKGDALERWHGRVFDARPDGNVDRSRSLWHLSVVLLEAGLNRLFVEDLIEQRDSSLGWTKFSGRRDAHARYRIIVDRAVAGRGPGPARIKGKASTERELDLFITGEQLLDVEDEDITWYAFGQVGGGLLTELDGKTKQAGKTTLIAALCRCILEGEPWLGEPTTYAPIVYLTEQSGPSFKRNMRRAGLLGRKDFHILLWSKVNTWKWPDVVMLARRKAAAVGAKILIVDTLAQFSLKQGQSENKAEDALLHMAPLQAAAGDGLAVLISRHDRKSAGDVGDSGRGSSSYTGAMDIVMRLQRVPGEHLGKERQRVLEAISRFEETKDQLLLEMSQVEPYEYRLIGDVEQVRQVRLRTEILANLSPDPDLALETKELRLLLECGANELAQALWALMKDKLVGRIGRGVRGEPHKYFLRPQEDDRDGD